MTAWTDFLKKHSGKGHSMSELSKMYNKSCKAPKKSSKKSSKKAPKKSSKKASKKSSKKAPKKPSKKSRTSQKLMKAIKTDPICKVCSLIKRADLDWQDSNGDTALMKAVKYNDITVVKALIRAGANVNIRNAKGETALSIEVYKSPRRNNILDLLIEAGADVNIKLLDGITLLMIAVKKDDYDAVESLLIAGAIPSKKVAKLGRWKYMKELILSYL